MLVNEIMHENPIVINTSLTLDEAYKLMVDKSIRHLPIVENSAIVGVITDRDLRLATSILAKKPFDASATVSEVMTSPVFTVNSTDPVGSAVKIMRDNKIGCLPVIEDGKIVGIITGVDLLDAMMNMTGMKKPGGRLDLSMKNEPGGLAKMTKIIADKNVNVHSILTHEDKNGLTRIILRVGTIDIRNLAENLCANGFNVLWPPHISCDK